MDYTETSCVNLKGCKYLEEEDFQLKSCSKFCAGYEWDKTTYPVKIEYFTDDEIKEITDNLGDPEGVNILNVKDLVFSILDDMYEWVALISNNEEYKNTILPQTIRDIMKDYVIILMGKDEFEIDKTNIYDWLVYLKKARVEFKKLNKIVERLDIA